jgi:DNA-binding CsgD family transcriptional regulator
MRQTDSARVYIDLADTCLAREREKELQAGRTLLSMTSDNFIMTLRAIADYAEGKAVNLHRMGRLNDEYWLNVRENELLIEEKINVRNRLEQQNLTLTIARQRILLYITWAAILLALTAVFMSVYIRRKQMKLTEAEERQEVLEKLLKETAAAGEEKSAFFKKALLQQLGLIRIVASAPTSHNQDLLKQVSLISNREIPSDDMLVWDDLYKLTDSLYEDFYTALASKYGEILTEKEKQLCCLLCAGFSTKEISVITRQGIQTIYQRKTTIRQKLEMDEKEDIIDFVKAQASHFLLI